MKKQRFIALLALVLALLLAMPCLALAEDEVVITEVVESAVADEEALSLDAAEEDVAEAPEETEASEEAPETPAETPAEAPAEETAGESAGTEEGFAADEAKAEEAPAEPVAQRLEASVAETEAQSLETPDEPVVVADEADASMKAASAGGPAAIAIDVSQGEDFWLGMGPVQLTAVLDPADAQTTLKWKSSNKKVVKVNGSGVITPRKAGKAKITVTTGNKKKSTMKVTVHKNKVNNINPKPGKAQIKALGANWDILLKSVELTAGGKYVASFYLLNNLGKSKRISDFGVQLFVGETLVAQKYLSKVKVACGKGKAKAFKVTFSGADIVAGPMLLPQFGAAGIRCGLTTAPTLVYGKNKTAVIQSAQQTDGGITADVTTDSVTGQTIDTNTGEIITVNLNELAAGATELVNAQRVANGLSALKTTEELTRAARVRAKELLTYYDHTRPDGSDFYTVSNKANGENIAFGFSSAELVVEGWMNSPGHRANILTKSFKTTGLAAAISDVDGFVYWVQLFGEDSK